MVNGKTKTTNTKRGNSVAEKTWRKIVGGPLWDGDNPQKSGEYTGPTPAFSATHHAVCMHMIRQQREMRVCMLIIYSRVWINRIRLLVLLVVN